MLTLDPFSVLSSQCFLSSEKAYATILGKNSGSCSQIRVSTKRDLFDLRDAAGVAIPRKGCFQPNANDLNGERGKDGALANGEHVGVVVLTCPAGGLFVPAHCATNAFDFVGDDGFAIAGPTKDDAAFEIVICDGEGDGANKERVIDWLGAVGAKIPDFVPPGSEQGLQHLFVIEPCVIGPDGNVHIRGFRERLRHPMPCFSRGRGIVNSDFVEIFGG